MKRLKEGKLDNRKKLKLAEKLLRGKEHNKGLTLYEENITEPSKIDDATLFNYATAQLKNGQIKNAINNFLKLRKRLEKKKAMIVVKKMLNDIRGNILLALNNKKRNQQNQKGQQNPHNQQNQQNKQKEQQQQNQTRGDKNEQRGKKSQMNKMAEALKKKEEELKKKRNSVKIPALLKQLLNDDRNLQNKYFDTSTLKKGVQEEVKDW